MANTVTRRDSDSQNGKEANDMIKQEGSEYLDYSPSEDTRTYGGILSKEDADFYHAFPEAARNKAYYKVDIRLVPMLALLYLFSCEHEHPFSFVKLCANHHDTVMDRANIGNAKSEGMNTDIGLTGVQYNIISSIFFVTYVIFGKLSLPRGRLICS